MRKTSLRLLLVVVFCLSSNCGGSVRSLDDECAEVAEIEAHFLDLNGRDLIESDALSPDGATIDVREEVEDIVSVDVGDVFDDICMPKCDGKVCGPDGCGGYCGPNVDGSCYWFDDVCLDDGTCCKPQCFGLECGEDSCGGSCGVNAGGCASPLETCVLGVCCKPNCAGRNCGDDGCGGTCGACVGQVCEQGVCVDQCLGVPCGDECCLQGACVDGACCAPDCGSRHCGDDGCGGSCGACPDGAECHGDRVCAWNGMAKVPAGTFWMGCNQVDMGNDAFDEYCSADERPQHEVESGAYFIDILEATAASYVSFLNESGKLSSDPDCMAAGTVFHCLYTPPVDLMAFSDGVWLTLAGSDTMPMYGLSYAGAFEYCEYQGKRLCTEAEWEKAARGGCEGYAEGQCQADAPLFPWGNQFPDCTLAQTGSCAPLGFSPVGLHAAGASPYGIEDMSGNVDEWVADCYHPGYDGAPSVATSWACEGGDWSGVVRGGGISVMPLKELRATARQPTATTGYSIQGVRCCRSE